MTQFAPAYARLLGIIFALDRDGAPICEMRPTITALNQPGSLHGGATASLLEQAGRAAIGHAISAASNGGRTPKAKLVQMTVDYLRTGPDALCYARGDISRLGGRVANVEVHAWSDDRGKPFAAARLTFLLVR